MQDLPHRRLGRGPDPAPHRPGHERPRNMALDNMALDADHEEVRSLGHPAA
ncbi:hypothetical protein [Streptomyces venezuelae]|uniref:hypothetical protein n=1 Tax=Streptomyces venezuelae TaxID=54571 RepID=UPI001686C517|nr:hypothetical protein [Streptomyces venezuelae]